MKKKYMLQILFLSGVVTLGLAACQQDEVGILNEKAVDKTDGALKDAASFPIGLAISEGTYKNNAAYREALATHASSTTFGYYMKHGALVDDGGNVNFTHADEIFNAVTTQGIQVFGHTLGWHSNQNAKYMQTVVNGSSGDAQVTAVSGALHDFITQTVTHYKGKVKAWDVVNEAITDNGALRTDANTSVPQGATDYFFWSKYLGEDWVLKAFQYAQAADPDALLFINDYNLEQSTAKLDALIALVNKMKAKGAKIDGIGTQMHISINTSYAMIDNMFEKLAATGLLIRISELDVRANPYDKPDFSYLTHTQAIAYQANMYEYVVKSYLKYVPAAQRHGITVWGIHDPDSWIVVYQNKVDAPLMFDATMTKKSAFYAVKNALQAAQ